MGNRIKKVQIIYEDGTKQELESGMIIESRVTEDQEKLQLKAHRVNILAEDEMAIYRGISTFWEQLQEMAKESMEE